jgi:hypothetical protein
MAGAASTNDKARAASGDFTAMTLPRIFEFTTLSIAVDGRPNLLAPRFITLDA